MDVSAAKFPNQLVTSIGTIIHCRISAVNSKGEIIAKKYKGHTDTIKITASEVQLFCRLPPEDTEENGFQILSLANDEEDNVYIVTQCEPTDDVHHWKLFVFDAKGNMKHRCPLQFLDGKNDYRSSHSLVVTATKDKKIIAHGHRNEQIHVCDSSGELKYSFPTKELDVDRLSISDENEIIAAGRFSKFVYIYTEEVNLKRKFEVLEDHKVFDLAFNHVTKEVIVLTWNDRHEYFISSYSTTGVKRETFRSPYRWARVFLTSHPSGPVALVYDHSVLY